jgi:hypothetical protein
MFEHELPEYIPATVGIGTLDSWLWIPGSSPRDAPE